MAVFLRGDHITDSTKCFLSLVAITQILLLDVQNGLQPSVYIILSTIQYQCDTDPVGGR